MTDALPRLTAALAGRYRVERELGHGGMATVYLAEDLRHRRRVAVKVLRPELAATMGAERFEREIQIAAGLQHPHILAVLDSGEAEGFLYYVMPFVDGESLRQRLDRGGELPVKDALRILAELVDALAAAHASGLVHRDIKPDNVMLAGRHALVMDFGVAKAVSDATGATRLTTAGVVLGTPAYMAPEQAAADPHLDHRVDIYAVGVLAYELLTGRPPFTALTAQQMLAAHVTQAPEPLERSRPGLPAGLSQIVMKCLAKRPADRWQTADELLAQLEPLATTSGGVAAVGVAGAPARGSAVTFPRWAAWLVGGALVAAGAFALTLRQAAPRTVTLGRRIAVASGAELERWPSLAPDGRSVVYTRWDDTSTAIVVRQVPGGAPMTVTGGHGGFRCCQALSPDGSRMLYRGDDGLYIMPTLGGQARKVADGAAHGSWSPDGRRIVYTPSFDSVVVMDIDGPARTTLATGRELHSPAWSQDGKWVAYVEGNTRFHSDGNNASSTVWLVPAAGGTAVNATGSASLNTSPVWIPGRRALLFISDRDGGRDIYQLAITRSGRPAGAPVRITTGLNPERLSISADGRWIAWSVLTIVSNVWSIDVPARDSVPFSAARPVTTGTQNVEGVSVSSDGAWLYFDSDRSGNADVWRLRLAGGEPEQLTTDPLGDFAPEPSPDGRYVAFHSLRNGTTNRDIFVMSADGGRAAQVSAGPGDDRDAHWSPDGRALAWLDRFSSDSAILVARRHDDGSWSAPRRYASPPNTGSVIWSDANVVEFFAAPGFFHLDTRTGGITRLVAGWQGPGHARSADGRVIYALVGDRIAALRLPDTTWNTLVYSDSAARRGIRGFALRGGKFFIPSPEPQMDVWVAELSSP